MKKNSPPGLADNLPPSIISIIRGYSQGTISDKEMTAWLKMVYVKGLTDDETILLVDAMISSGATMDFSHLGTYVADKHSTGGVGDKVSLILGPLMAASGLAIPMITGRSLGHTGGTLDKLEAIPGYRADLSLEEFAKVVETVGVSIVGQTDEICPADKKIYALRDRTNTVKSIPLICGSIMSKKIAEGIQGLVMDVKVGNGAFMSSLDEAKELGQKLAMIGEQFGVSTDVIYTDMNQPLGHEAGLWNEIEEVIQSLQGKGPDDLMTVVYELGSALLIQAKKADTREKAKTVLKKQIENGSAFEKFLAMVKAHGGDISNLENPEKFESPKYVAEVVAQRSGYVTGMDTRALGEIVNGLTIRYSSNKRLTIPQGGIKFYKKIGASVKKGDVLALCQGESEDTVSVAEKNLSKYIKIGKNAPPTLTIIYTAL
ncbi:MAG: thymidine phosphorylase [Candidatus Marinimicrobia bacterium]|nr:thymidine phosphorylase [Candidatus Neomarinimicrobiota bacterium]